MSETLNANPTIRNATDLPSRRRHDSSKAGHKPLGLFASTVPAAAHFSDPFLATDLPELSDGASDSDVDGDAVEPIDEQEIYGMFRLSIRYPIALRSNPLSFKATPILHNAQPVLSPVVILGATFPRSSVSSPTSLTISSTKTSLPQ